MAVAASPREAIAALQRQMEAAIVGQQANGPLLLSDITGGEVIH